MSRSGGIICLRKKNRRRHLSTWITAGVCLAISLTALLFIYLHMVGISEDVREQQASSDVFRTAELTTLTGNTVFYFILKNAAH